MKKKNVLSNRIEFVVLLDATDSNPNGDPDANNQPRVDPETSHGLITDGCVKRKIRNAVSIINRDAAGAPLPGYEIYVAERGILAAQHARAYESIGQVPDGNENLAARQAMCDIFFDVRAFGAVMNVGKSANGTTINCGQVTGPIQIQFARSVDKVYPTEHAITRVALTNADDTKKGKKIAEARKAAALAGEDVDSSPDDRASSGQMGSKWTIPYGLYRCHGYVSPHFAQTTQFSEDDLRVLWDAVLRMYDFDKSAARAGMAVRELVVFRHESFLGNYPAHKTIELVRVARKPGVDTPRSYSDYTVTVGEPPAGVSVTRMKPEEVLAAAVA